MPFRLPLGGAARPQLRTLSTNARAISEFSTSGGPPVRRAVVGLIDKLPDAYPNMADIQTPLPLEVRSRSRGHLLSKSDLWTPCVVDVVIR